MPTEIKAQNTTTLASVKAIYDAADQANTLLDGMQTAAIAAGTTLDGIYQDAADAQTAADDAQASADNASEYAARALGNLSTVQNITETLNWITAHGTMTLTSDVALDPTHVYFVVDPAGDYVVGGTHYSVVTEPDVADISTYYELSINESLNNYVATHLAVDSEGLWIIPDAGGNKVLIATGSGSTYTTAGTYIVGKVNGVDAVFAKFTADGATMQRGSTNIAHLGYGPGTSSGGGTANAPYYTLGIRSSYSTIGNYSIAEGYTTAASGYSSHAEGSITAASGSSSHAEGSASRAIGSNSHAEGSSTEASGLSSHAEGIYTDAIGNYSHAEGDSTEASGDYSHSQNSNTIAQRKSQTVIGEYNIADTAGADGTERGDYVFIIGNGEGIIENPRSNALTVDWSGNVEAAGGGVFGDDVSVTGDVTATGDVTDGSNNTLSSIAAHAVISTGSSNGWNYKKYADGTFEATRFSTNGSTGAMTQVGSTGIYYSSAAEITFPSIGITGITSCLASVMPSSNYLMSYYMSRLTTAHVYFSYIRYGSGSAVTGISYGISITGTYS